MKRFLIFLLLIWAFVLYAEITCAQGQPTALDKALLEACKQGNVDKAQELIKEGANINSHHGEYGITPLMWASANGHLGIVELLICNGADVNVQADKIGIALHVAGNTKIMELLLCNGADIEAKDNFNMLTPLFNAVAKCDLEAVKFLVSRGANVNATMYGGGTPLGHATAAVSSPCGSRQGCKKNSLEVFKFLMQSGADPNIVQSNKQTVTEYVASHAKIGMADKKFDKCWKPHNQRVLNILNSYSGNAKVISRDQWHCPKLKCKRQCKLVLQKPDPDVIPANPKYCSRISFALECTGPSNSDGAETKHKVNIKRKLPRGQLVLSKGDYNYDRDLELMVKEGEKTNVFYKWVGPIKQKDLEHPLDETITFTTNVSEKEIIKEVKLSVGIDLAIDEIEPVRKGEGEICPSREETFRVFVKDAFHPDKSMAEMAKRFKAKHRLYVDRKGKVEDPFDFSDMQYGLFGPLAQEVFKLLYKTEFLASNRVVQDCQCEGCEWAIKDYEVSANLPIT